MDRQLLGRQTDRQAGWLADRQMEATTHTGMQPVRQNDTGKQISRRLNRYTYKQMDRQMKGILADAKTDKPVDIRTDRWTDINMDRRTVIHIYRWTDTCVYIQMDRYKSRHRY